MARNLEFETWSLISGPLARRFSVIPLKQCDGVLYVLTDQKLAPRQREETEQQMSRAVGKSVRIEIADDTWAPSEFSATFERYYRANLDHLSVLFVHADDDWSDEFGADQKTLLDQLSGQGHLFQRVHGINEATAVCRNPRGRRIDMVVIADAIPDGFEAARARLRGVTDVPIVALSRLLRNEIVPMPQAQ